MRAFRIWRGRVVTLLLVVGLAIAGVTAASAQSANGGRGRAPSSTPGEGRGDVLRPPLAGAPSADCGGALVFPDTSAIADAGDAVKAVSRVASNYLKACNCPATSCIADILDSYARELSAIAPRLPPQLRDMPEIVATAARRVRHARNKAEASAILEAAIEHVHKEIALIRVEDADKQDRPTRGGDFVVGTLATAKESLLRADSI